MEIMYQVIWHEENQTGVQEHVMGASPLLPTRQAAEDWLNSTMAEDRERAGENEEALFVENLGDGVWKTAGNNQHCFYRIETVDVPDDGERADRAEALIDTLNRLAVLGSRDEMCERIADYYREVQTKDYLVDLRCCPSLCVRVKARSAEEAERIVSEQVDSRTLFLSEEQKNGLVNDILENVDEIEAQEGG
jgi:alkanesulfonate monooxygenase SsuD/methylene tetrahydromethanopterin reductase-like flavin-dependent oxidoreductase (luciferase family)